MAFWQVLIFVASCVVVCGADTYDGQQIVNKKENPQPEIQGSKLSPDQRLYDTPLPFSSNDNSGNEKHEPRFTKNPVQNWYYITVNEKQVRPIGPNVAHLHSGENEEDHKKGFPNYPKLMDINKILSMKRSDGAEKSGLESSSELHNLLDAALRKNALDPFRGKLESDTEEKSNKDSYNISELDTLVYGNEQTNLHTNQNEEKNEDISKLNKMSFNADVTNKYVTEKDNNPHHEGGSSEYQTLDVVAIDKLWLNETEGLEPHHLNNTALKSKEHNGTLVNKTELYFNPSFVNSFEIGEMRSESKDRDEGVHSKFHETSQHTSDEVASSSKKIISEKGVIEKFNNESANQTSLLKVNQDVVYDDTSLNINETSLFEKQSRIDGEGVFTTVFYDTLSDESPLKITDADTLDLGQQNSSETQSYDYSFSNQSSYTSYKLNSTDGNKVSDLNVIYLSDAILSRRNLSTKENLSLSAGNIRLENETGPQKVDNHMLNIALQMLLCSDRIQEMALGHLFIDLHHYFNASFDDVVPQEIILVHFSSQEDWSQRENLQADFQNAVISHPSHPESENEIYWEPILLDPTLSVLQNLLQKYQGYQDKVQDLRDMLTEQIFSQFGESWEYDMICNQPTSQLFQNYDLSLLFLTSPSQTRENDNHLTKSKPPNPTLVSLVMKGKRFPENPKYLDSRSFNDHYSRENDIHALNDSLRMGNFEKFIYIFKILNIDEYSEDFQLKDIQSEKNFYEFENSGTELQPLPSASDGIFDSVYNGIAELRQIVPIGTILTILGTLASIALNFLLGTIVPDIISAIVTNPGILFLLLGLPLLALKASNKIKGGYGHKYPILIPYPILKGFGKGHHKKVPDKHIHNHHSTVVKISPPPNYVNVHNPPPPPPKIHHHTEYVYVPVDGHKKEKHKHKYIDKSFVLDDLESSETYLDQLIEEYVDTFKLPYRKSF